MSSETRIVGATLVSPGVFPPLPDGEVAFGTGGAITYVGPSRGEPGAGDIDARGTVVLPGLVNAHTHTGMGLLRGVADEGDLQTWLTAVRATEVRCDADDLYWALQLGMAEMIRTGTTAFTDMFHWDERLLGSVADAGLRVLAAPGVFGYDAVGYPAAGSPEGRTALNDTERLAAEFAGEPLVRLAYGPHAPYTCPPELLTEVADRAGRTGLPVHIHLSETRFEVTTCLEEHGATPIALAARTGILAAGCHVAHATHATADDAKLLAEAGASVAHNPLSNLKLGAGIAPVTEWLDAGVKVTVGTDSVASNNNLDLHEELKTTVLLQRGRNEDPAALSAEQALRMATVDGADALGFPGGRLEVGRPADVIVVDATGLAALPAHEPVSYLVYTAGGQDVRDVVVNGRVLLRDRALTTIDAGRLRHEVTTRSERLQREATS